MSKIKRSHVVTALKNLDPDKLYEFAKGNGVAAAMKLRSDLVKTVMAYDLNGE
jgi:hypothetical protein